MFLHQQAQPRHLYKLKLTSESHCTKSSALASKYALTSHVV